MALLPPGYNTVTPYFLVDRAAEFIDFLVRGLGGKELSRPSANGRGAHAEVRLGSSTVMISEARSDYAAMRAAYYLYVENADATMASAVAAGAEQVMAVQDMDYGDRQGGVRDKHGNLWWISQRLVSGPYST